MILSEAAPAKLNLALHVRGRLPDGRHALETLFAFCIDGDRVEGELADTFSLEIVGPFAPALDAGEDNLVIRAARALAAEAGVEARARLKLTKNLPVASGIGGGSADAAATLRLLTRLWEIDPAHASAVAPGLGADVPACLLSMTARGSGAGDALTLTDAGVAGAAVLLVNPGVAVSTATIFSRWDGVDRGPLDDWREGRNDLEPAACTIAPQVQDVLGWLRAQPGVDLARMSGSGATCFALFADDDARDAAASELAHERPNWWHMATHLR